MASAGLAFKAAETAMERKKRMRHSCLGVAVFIALWSTAWGNETLKSEEGASEKSGGMAEVWIISARQTAARHAEIRLEANDSYPVTQKIPFVCAIRSERPFKEALLEMEIRDGDQHLAARGEVLLNLYEGPNSCLFEWDAQSVSTGTYQALFRLSYTHDESPAICEATLKKVTEQQLRNDLDEVSAHISQLREALPGLSSASGALTLLELRLRIAEKFAGRMREKISDRAWRQADGYLAYLDRTVDAVHAGMVLGAFTPELLEPAPIPNLSQLEVRDGAFFCEGRPVFLFGRTIPEPSGDAIRSIAHDGLNLAVLAMGPDTVLSSSPDSAEFRDRFAPVFAASQERNVALTVRLSPQNLGSWAREQWPNITDKGFVDVADPGAKTLFEQHLKTLLPYLAEQRMVRSLCIADEPQFKFDGEEIRRAFINRVRQEYPERQELNQVWRAHLADFDEITIWDDAAPAYSYQNRRAYQYDWQSFHRGLIDAYFAAIVAKVRELAPGMPLEAMLPDNVFDEGETRQGVDRESLAQVMDISGCSATTNPNDSYYALSYPRQSAFYTLMRSFQPDKPVLNLQDHILLDDTLTPEYRHTYVQTAMWEAVMSGVNGTSLAEDTTIFDHPETAEAYSAACLNINRLAPIVAAFQQAPADILVLFSEASKIFDNGEPHLKSARYAYEGCSFSGYNVRFITDQQCAQSGLTGVKVLVIPETPAVPEDTFAALLAYVKSGGAVARVGTPIPYDEKGHSRREVLPNTANTVLVRGLNLPTEYLHAIDAAIVLGSLPTIPRTVNAYRYPIEGVKTRYIEYEGEHYLYLVNLRKTEVTCFLAGNLQTGRDLILGRTVSFPQRVAPLDPMLIRFDHREGLDAELTPQDPEAEKGIHPPNLKKKLDEYLLL